MINCARARIGLKSLCCLFRNNKSTVFENCLYKNEARACKIFPHGSIKRLKRDTIEIKQIKTELKEGHKYNYNYQKINIPKCRFKAPRPGFDESLNAYVNVIKNNKKELKNLCSKYIQNELNEEQFVNKYAEFLSEKMNMPYYPELKKIISDTIGGGYQSTTNILYYNPSNMNRLSDLMATVNHEMHHFLQQKEIFATMSIEQFSRLKARAAIIADLPKRPNLYRTQADIEKAIERETKCYIKDFKDAGWDKVIEKYPKNINQNSPYYKRAQELIKADLNYVDGTENVSKYMANILEKEAYEISVHTQLEIEHSIMNVLSKKEKEIALEIYDCLNSPSFAEIKEVSGLIESFNRNPYNLVEIVKEANAMGLNDPYSIIQRIL